ncbi:uncharacterized protein LOC113208218 [Frankliniella occidentalis]|uniref:Uncharacterized protein LOC113208218 n=1 Tax=Frankliniella occidentalis TaxID=133901 RepID=A0A9C6U294_FRAOC|nr:uncharacterized protein LOC113208218 [Frankliniella occidentalis]
MMEQLGDASNNWEGRPTAENEDHTAARVQVEVETTNCVVTRSKRKQAEAKGLPASKRNKATNAQNEDGDVRNASVEEILDDTHPKRNVQEDNPSLSMERIYLKVIKSATELRQLAEAAIDGHLQEIEALKRELEKEKRAGGSGG